MKRPSSIALLPSKEIGERSLGAENPVSRITHKNVESVAFSNPDNALSILASGPAVNSQDLNVDWAKFENHTFFDSAAGKVNTSFLRIINDFPYDGTKKEVYDFVSGLSGYEKYIYDQFTKSVGYYDFAGTSHISVSDSAGAEFPDFSRDSTGRGVLDPAGGPITIQMHLMPEASANSHQVVAQYAQSETMGITLFLSQSSSTSAASLCFTVCSGTLSASVEAPIVKGKFQHIAAVYLPSGVTSSLEMYRDGVLQTTSSQVVQLGSSLGASKFNIASGSSFNFNGINFVPSQILNASIDDLRVYHAARKPGDLHFDIDYSAYADDETDAGLRLYYKFNEPPGDHAHASVALDSSGNCLHTTITSYSNSQRVTGSSALIKEDEKYNPVLFPDFSLTAALNADLLVSGTAYDKENPNYIVRLIPQHYFLEGQQQAGFQNVQGEIDSSVSGNGIPGSGKMGSVQIMTAILMMYAKVFDEIKIFHDHFSKLTYVDYDADSSVSDRFLLFLASYYGIDLPNLFSKSTIDQYLLGEHLQTSATAQMPLRTVQSAIFRRILTNIRDIVTSKGTHAGIKALFNAAGIAPNAFFRIREFGGPSEVFLSALRDDVTEVASALDMSGSLALPAGAVDSLGFRSDFPRVIGSYLSSSRSEVGFPFPAGAFVSSPGTYHGVSSQPADGLLTSGSWTFESSYKFDDETRGAESLARMHVTGTLAPSSKHGVIFNIVAISGSVPTISAYVSSDTTGVTAPISLHVSGANIFSGDRWHVALTRQRSDDPTQTVTSVSSSYSLRCARISPGGTATYYSASGFFDEGPLSNNAMQSLSAYNTSGSFIVFGSQSLEPGTSFLNSSVSSEVKTTQFSGRIFSTRFWSKALSEEEFREHARSYRSFGVDSPIVNFGFNTTSTGSFEKLRMDISFDQEVTGSSALGEISLLDMSQQGKSALGLGFEANQTVIKPETQRFSQISTRFDVRQTTDKVRVRSFTEVENLNDFPGSLPTPIYEQTRSEIPISDSRVSVEASAVDAINDDIVKLISTLDFFEAALGDPRVLNEDDYPDLDKLRKIYFNRLIAKPDLRAMYEVFRWVSDALGGLIVQLVPMNSVFLGISYIIESHVAERARVRYYFDSVYKEKTQPEKYQKTVSDVAGSTSRDAGASVATKSMRG